MIALAHGAGLDALQIAAGSGLGHGDGGDHLAGAELRQPAGLLLVVGLVQQIGRHDVVVQRETEAAVAAGDGLLDHDGVVAEVGVASAAVLLRHRHAEEALLARLEPDAAVDDLVLLPLVVEGLDLLVEEGPVGLPEQIMLGLEKGAGVLDGIAHEGPPGNG